MIAKDNLNQTLDRRLAHAERRLGRGIAAALYAARPSAVKVEAEPEGAVVQKECRVLADIEGFVRESRQAVESYPRELLSDHLPGAYPTASFGESVWCGFFGAPITFAGTRSYTWSYCAEPPLKDYGSFPFQPLDPSNRWYRAMLDVTAYCVAHLPAICDMCAFVFMDCLNLLVELRGSTAAYLDIYEHQEDLARFLDWSVEVNCQLFDEQSALMRDFTAAAFDNHPFHRYSAACIPNLSVDAYGLCRAEVYRQSGLDQHRRIVERYGGGRLHIHGNGRHLCDLIPGLGNLTSCFMGDDVGYPPAWTLVRELRDRMSPVPVEVSMPRDAFVDGLRRRTLPAGVFYRVGAESVEDANRIMNDVFNYRE